MAALKQKVNPAHSSKLRAAELLVDAAGDSVKTVMDIADRGLEEVLFDILTPQQAAKFTEYMAENSGRIGKAFGGAAQVQEVRPCESQSDGLGCRVFPPGSLIRSADTFARDVRAVSPDAVSNAVNATSFAS